MKGPQVISINPGVKTVGEMGGTPAQARLARISRRLTSPGKTGRSMFVRVINLLFGINTKVDTQLSRKLMLLRLLCGSLMVSSILIPMTPESILALDFGPHALIMCVLGISLVFGLLTRPMAYTGAAWFGYKLILSLMALTPDVTAGAMMLLMLVFCVLGPGMFSADQLVRRALFKLRRKILAARKARREKNSITYRAFAEVERRIG